MTKVELCLPRIARTPVPIRSIRIVSRANILGDQQRIRHAVNDARCRVKPLRAFVARRIFKVPVLVEEQAQTKKHIAVRWIAVVHISRDAHLTVTVQIQHRVERIDDTVLYRIQHRRFTNATVHGVAQVTSTIGGNIRRTREQFDVRFRQGLVRGKLQQLLMIPAIGEIRSINPTQHFDHPVVMRPRIGFIRPTPIRRRWKPLFLLRRIQ